MSKRTDYDQAAAYEIQLKGILDSSWSDWFDGFNIQIREDITVMTGTVSDQAALHGMLAKINDLGLSIITVKKTCLENK